MDSQDLVARWTWSIDRDRSYISGAEGPGRYRVRSRGAERARYINQMVSVSSIRRLVVDGLTLSPSFVSYISGCMRAIIPGMGALDYCIIC